MLQVSQLSKAFGARTLFDDVTFSMIAGERLGLVGRNGCGKSTLFKLILEEEHPDSGTITFPRGYRVGHLAQHIRFTKPTVLEEACLGLQEHEKDLQYKAEIILDGLGFSLEDLHKSPQDFSGGFQIRINLAKLLLSEPNLLLLDEPTNYLDIISVRWLSDFLREWEGELIMISHDRLFMDSVTTHSMLIHRGSIRKVKGPTDKLYEQVFKDEEIYEKTRLNEEKKRKQLEEFISRFRAQASKATLVQSKVKALERMGQKEALQDEDLLSFSFSAAPFESKQVMDVRNLTFGYETNHPLISDFNLLLNKGDRVGVIGKNGKGKSTLLRLLARDLTANKGTISYNPNVRLGYFGQTNISRLDPKLTVEEEVGHSNPRLTRTQVRGICGTMMFSGDDALKKIGVLSGGEKSRVLLGKILAEPTNLLLLDEPTNHLDMESIEALIQSLRDYPGAVIIVTHSELILQELATRLVVFEGDAPFNFEHDYRYFLQKHGWGHDASMTQSADREARSVAKAESSSTEESDRKVSQIEDKLSKLETKQKQLEEALAKAYQTNNEGEVTIALSKLEKVKADIEACFGDLEKLS